MIAELLSAFVETGVFAPLKTGIDTLINPADFFVASVCTLYNVNTAVLDVKNVFPPLVNVGSTILFHLP